MSALESSAMHFRLDTSRDQYQLLREIMLDHNACVLTSWKDIQDVHKELLPPGSTCHLDSNGNAVWQIPMANVAHHHIRRILDDPRVLARMVSLKAACPEVIFTLIFKYGADGANGQAVYRFGGNIGNMFASVFSTVQLKAQLVMKDANGTTIMDANGEPKKKVWVIFANRNCNSESSHVYLRLSYEKEFKGKIIFIHLIRA